MRTISTAFATLATFGFVTFAAPVPDRPICPYVGCGPQGPVYRELGALGAGTVPGTTDHAHVARIPPPEVFPKVPEIKRDARPPPTTITESVVKKTEDTIPTPTSLTNQAVDKRNPAKPVPLPPYKPNPYGNRDASPMTCGEDGCPHTGWDRRGVEPTPKPTYPLELAHRIPPPPTCTNYDCRRSEPVETAGFGKRGTAGVGGHHARSPEGPVTGVGHRPRGLESPRGECEGSSRGRPGMLKEPPPGGVESLP